MKKIATTLLTFVLATSAYALPLGNPWEASLMSEGVFCEGFCVDPCDPCVRWYDALSFRIGFYGDYVFDRHMEVDQNEGTPSIHKTEIWTNAGYFAFNIWDRFDFFATLGTSEIEINTPSKSFNGPVNDYATVQTETAFSWSVGARGTIWEIGEFGLGAEFQYFQACPDINFVKEENTAPIYRSGDELRYKEWQVGLGAAYRINIASCATALIPYIGIKGGHAWMKLGDFVADGLVYKNLRNERDFGYVFGLTLLGCNKITLTAETRFSDEKALYVNGQFRF